MALLDHFQLEDLKKMNINELETLATEIRSLILSSVSTNGGHLSSNLGVVELTIALHRVFDSPKDLIIYDVSHQMYAHKILTGRKDDFTTLRQMNGISGFARTKESIHDVFEAGHSSTSISAGLGFLEAKKADISNDIKDIITVIGDASITNGLAFEALNYLAAHSEQKMIIILNDNEMSISKNVGALARQFNKIRAKGHFKFLRKITPQGIKRMLKSLAYHQNIFESLGIKYFEGINGHDFNDLLKYLTFAKNANHSILLHVKTIKGKGYKYSEEDASGYWHHVEPFDLVTGLPLANRYLPSFGEIIGNHLVDLINNSSQYHNLRVITPAMSLGSGLSNFQNACPNHFIDVGIAEEMAVVMASGMALKGLLPIVFIYSTFLQRAYDQIIHDIARTKQKVIFCVDRAGLVDHDGDTHQGVYDVAFLSTIPNVTILAPKNVEEALLAIDYAIEKVNGPIFIRYPKNDENTMLLADRHFDQWDIVKEITTQETINPKIYIISYGNLLHYLVETFKDDDKIGIINAKNLSIIDSALLTMIAQKKAQLVIYEEVIENNSLASKIMIEIHKMKLTLSIKSIALPNTYFEVGTRQELLNKYLPKIVEVIKEDLSNVN